MTINNKNSSNTSFAKPAAADNLLPSGVSHTTRRRKGRSYSALNYEWAVYKSKGKTLSEYKPLSKFETFSAQYSRAARAKTKTQQLSDTRKLKDAVQESRRIEKGFFNDINAFFSLFGSNFYNWFSSFVFDAYFYKNIIFYYFVWLSFYVQEYVYVNISLYFPIFDWITTNLVFAWPVHLDIYFLRLAFSLFLPVFIIFFFFHHKLQVNSKFDLLLGAGQFVLFFGSIGLYQFTGLAPFLFVLAGSPVLLFFFTFYYFIPRHIIRSFIHPPLYLAPPNEPKRLCLPLYRYRFPFPDSRGQRAKSAVSPTRFTSYPFTTRVSQLAHHNRFVAQVHLAALCGALSPYPRKPRAPVTSPSFLDAGFYFNENPYDYYENYLNGRLFRREDNLLTYESMNEEDDYVKQDKDHSFAPGLMNNVTFFSSSFRLSAASLYGSHFSSDFDTFGAGYSPNLPLWRRELLNDRYFSLYIWLKNVAPLYAASAPVSPYYQLPFTKTFLYSAGPATVPYPLFTRLLLFFYALLEFTFDRLTFIHFTAIDHKPASFAKFYQQFALLAWLLKKRTFKPSKSFLKATVKLSIFADFWLDSSRLSADSRTGDPVLDHTTRFELIHLISFSARVLTRHLLSMQKTSAKRHQLLYCRLLLRNLDKILLKLAIVHLNFFI